MSPLKTVNLQKEKPYSSVHINFSRWNKIIAFPCWFAGYSLGLSKSSAISEILFVIDPAAHEWNRFLVGRDLLRSEGNKASFMAELFANQFKLIIMS